MGYFRTLCSPTSAPYRPLSEVYTAEHERWIRGSVAMRSEEVRAILAGAKVDVTEVSSRLRYRLDGRHLGFVIWNQGEGGKLDGGHGPGVFDEMDRLAAKLADSAGASSALLLPIGSYYAGWAAVAERPRSELAAAWPGRLADRARACRPRRRGLPAQPPGGAAH